MRAVMLAAGAGGRLGALTASLPKPIVPLAGRPLFAYTLDALAGAGVTEVVVVTGYRRQQVERALEREETGKAVARSVFNPEFRRGASYSLKAAREACGDDNFLLVMSDHVFGDGLLERLVGSPGGVSAVAADFALGQHEAAYALEATKLRVDESGYVRAIGKDVAGFNAFDTGAFLCTPAIWEAAAAAPADCELSVIFGELAGRDGLRATDVSGCFWYDIDTDADLRAVSAMLPGLVDVL